VSLNSSEFVQDAMAAKERLTRAEVQCQNLRAEKELLKTSESRLLHEKESVIREQRSQSQLMANLQAIQVSGK